MAQSKFVICIENSDYTASLEKRKIYQVITDAAAVKINYIRVVDESGGDYLYASSMSICQRPLKLLWFTPHKNGDNLDPNSNTPQIRSFRWLDL